jgi:hypothetical protein
VNPRAIAAFVIAILPVVPGFARAVVTPGGTVADPTLVDRLYSYAWFVTFGLSFVAYLGLMRGVGRGGSGGVILSEAKDLADKSPGPIQQDPSLRSG